MTESARTRVSDWLRNHRDGLARLALDLGGTPSPRGAEGPASDRLAEWFRDEGVDAREQTVVGDRRNVVGVVRGKGGEAAGSLLFNAHLDTAFGNAAEDERVLSRRGRFHTDAWRDGDVLYGDGVVNDKGPMAAFLWAAKALRETDVELGGDLFLTGVVGEISGAQVEEYRGPEYPGVGVGARHLVESGVTADCALVAETTDFAAARVECGVAWFRIAVSGRGGYQPRVVLGPGDPVATAHPGALPRAARAALRLEEWAADYAAANTREYDHGTMRPSAGVGAIRSGNPQAPAIAPGAATLYLDVRLPPGEGPGFVRDDVEAVLADAGVDATVDCYLYRRGYVADADGVAPLADAYRRAHRRVRGDDPPRPAPEVTSMWRDVNVFNEVGVPALTAGPPRLTRTVDGERAQGLRVDDLVDAAALYAHCALAVCGD